MKKIRSAAEVLGSGALALGSLAVAAFILSPLFPLPFLIVTIGALGGTVALLLQRFLPQAGELVVLNKALNERNIEVQTAVAGLNELSLIDPLTGARNRRGFINLVEHQMRVASREWKKLHFLFVDIDGMKMINDLYGQEAGDSALITVVETLWASSRTVDIVARMGNDEFAVALLHAEDPKVIADRIRSAISSRTRTAEHPYELHVTVGIASFDPAAPVTVEDILHDADQVIVQQKTAAALARSKGLTAPVML
jgi:diguanylate cyclase (GGDEF)-like protein